MRLGDKIQAVVQAMHDRLEAWGGGLVEAQSTDGLERVRNLLVRLRGTLWLVPALVSLVFLALAIVLLSIAPAIAIGDSGRWWLFSGDADTARNLLGTLTSAMITMTSLVVSITVVVLTLAANQLGPRLVSTFMGDRHIKLVLGLFIGTILYLLTVLRSISGTQQTSLVPHLAVTVGTVLSVSCLFALLYFVHKIARSIIADTVIGTVAGDLRSSVKANLPEQEGERRSDATAVGFDRANPTTIGRTGYVQVVDHAALVELAREHGLRIRIDVRAGSFVLAGGRYLCVEGELDERQKEAIDHAFVVGGERTPAQDVEFAIRQLVEIALRALSPGINDPFTAVTVIHRVSGELANAMTRALPPTAYDDSEGVPRVFTSPPTWDDLLGAAFVQIRDAAGDHPIVLHELQAMLRSLQELAQNEEQKRAIERQLVGPAPTAPESAASGRGGRKRDERRAVATR